MVAVAFQLIVRWCWTISCERFFKACWRSQNYDVILGYSKTNQRTSCITYLHNIYLQWHVQQDPKVFFSIILISTDRCDFPHQSLKPESLSLSFICLIVASSHSSLPIRSLSNFSPSLQRPSFVCRPRQQQLQQQQRRQLQQQRQQHIKHFYSGGIMAATGCISCARVIDILDPRAPSKFTRCHDRPLTFAIPSVTTDIFKRQIVLDLCAICFIYIRPPSNMQNQFTIRISIHNCV